jgi:hypothetical protein
VRGCVIITFRLWGWRRRLREKNGKGRRGRAVQLDVKEYCFWVG